jgi:pimeloyl-ACP methyl ester carboxylesterase
LGPVVFHGRDTGRPVLLVILGAFATFKQLDRIQDLIPGVDVWRTHLPGNHCPPLQVTSVGAFGFAISQAIGERLSGRQVAVVGVSAGALVGLALDQRLIRRFLLVEPPLWPTVCWPFLDFRDHMPPDGEDFVRRIFGVGPTSVEARDYRGLLDRLTKPALVLIGDEPLEPLRALPRWPSLVDADSRRRLAAHPLVYLRVVAGAAHDLIGDQPEAFWAALLSIMN